MKIKFRIYFHFLKDRNIEQFLLGQFLLLLSVNNKNKRKKKQVQE